jgi:predicted DNA-binding protein with PD1-like motif
MRSKLVSDNGLKAFVLVLDSGDEVMETLTAFARREGLGASHFSGIGAFSDAVIAFFDWERRDYDRIPVDEQVEVLAFSGDITLQESEPKVHAHVVLGTRDGSARGGHLLEARVRPTLEILLTESPHHLRRTYDAESMLPLIDLDGKGAASRPRRVK